MIIAKKELTLLTSHPRLNRTSSVIQRKNANTFGIKTRNENQVDLQ